MSYSSKYLACLSNCMVLISCARTPHAGRVFLMFSSSFFFVEDGHGGCGWRSLGQVGSCVVSYIELGSFGGTAVFPLGTTNVSASALTIFIPYRRNERCYSSKCERTKVGTHSTLCFCSQLSKVQIAPMRV